MHDMSMLGQGYESGMSMILICCEYGVNLSYAWYEYVGTMIWE